MTPITRGIKILMIAVLTITLVMTWGTAFAAQMTIRYATGTPKSHPQDQGADFFAYMVEKESKGEIEVRVFHAGSLGAHREAMEGMQMGTVDMFVGALAFMVPFYQPLGMLEMPFLFRDLDHARKVTHGPIGKAWQEEFLKKTNVRLISWSGASFSNFYNSSRQIKTFEDVKGLKMRVMDNEIRVASMNAWGAKGVPMSFPEFYSAMEQRVVDGGENPYSMYASAKHNEVAKYLTESNHSYLAAGILISEKFYQSLSPKHKEIIDRAAVASGNVAAWLWDQREDQAKREVMQQGAQVYVLPESERARLEKAVQPVYERFAPNLGGMDLVRKIKDIK